VTTGYQVCPNRIFYVFLYFLTYFLLILDADAVPNGHKRANGYEEGRAGAGTGLWAARCTQFFSFSFIFLTSFNVRPPRQAGNALPQTTRRRGATAAAEEEEGCSRRQELLQQQQTTRAAATAAMMTTGCCNSSDDDDGLLQQQRRRRRAAAATR
jgi:hypothetical protein